MEKKIMDLKAGLLVSVKAETEMVRLLENVFDKIYPDFDVAKEVGRVCTLLHKSNTVPKYIAIGYYEGIYVCAFVIEKPKKLKHLQTSYVYAYVSNPAIPFFSEFGDIIIQNINGKNYYRL